MTKTRNAATCAVALAITWCMLPAPHANAQSGEIPGGYSQTVFQVKFAESATVDRPASLLSANVQGLMSDIRPLFNLPPQTLTSMRLQAQRRAGNPLPDLNRWFELHVPEGTDAGAVLRELRTNPAIERVQPAPLPEKLPAVTPDFTDQQTYLDPATDGINAEYAWTFPGGNSSGITIYDVEYNWLQTHEDLTAAAGVTLLVDAGDSNSPPGYDGCPAPCHPLNREHGTAVLGEMIGDNDSKGVTGISWGANIGLAPARTSDLGFNPANAIALAILDSDIGDIILIEQQTGVCDLDLDCDGPGGDCGPLEWIGSVYDTIVIGTALGRIIVEAAGNGGVNLDQAACGDYFNPAVQHSGAIIVGAGQPPTESDRTREGFSSYGNRVDLQGYGGGVMTTGYGTNYSDPDDPTNPDKWYRFSFGGTSSASPIVTGAVAAMQGINKAAYGTTLTAAQIRDILVATGSPQTGNVAQHIGPRPDLRFAIADIINVPPVADADGDQTLECTGHNGTPATLDGSGSYDDNGDPLTYTWTGPFPEGGGTVNGVSPVVTLALGTHTITLTVDDGNGESDSDDVEITIEDTTDPEIALVGDAEITLECALEEYIEQGATATDICDPDPEVTIDGTVDTGTPGDYTLTYTATDDSGNSSDIDRTVTIVDTTPPDITVGADPMSLWPPNGKYVSVSLDDLDVDAVDVCDETVAGDDVVIAEATSDEPENDLADGDTIDDIVLSACRDVDVRRERQGGEDGRVYTLLLEVADASDNVGEGAYQIHVPANVATSPWAVEGAVAYSVDGCDPLASAVARFAADSPVEVELQSAATAVIEFYLDQNYPNPFNPVTAIRFGLPEDASVSLTVHDMLGRRIAVLVDGGLSAGLHTVSWDASAWPSGSYVYLLEAGEVEVRRQMLLLK